MSNARIVAAGNLPKLRAKNTDRLGVYLMRGNTVLAETPVARDGSFRFSVAESIVRDHTVSAVLGPKGVDHHALVDRADLPRLHLSRATANAEDPGRLTLDFNQHRITDEIIEPWWDWCSDYTVSGTLRSPDGCPVPGASVTVYNVTHGIGGLVKTPRATVSTAADGTFTATFNWCECLCCWPCWPIWWECWPWWWDLDILHIIETIERRLPPVQSPLGEKFALSARANVAPLKRPDTADLMTGQAFAHLRPDTEIVQDASRVSLIKSKLSDARIRELFPWYWWCCDEPNIVFRATQSGNVVLDEDPNTSTRWCFESGQTVTLIANALAISLCPTPPAPVPDGFGWIQVGSTGVADIVQGYAKGSGADASDMAFFGGLDIYGGFWDPAPVAFYQVLAENFNGNHNPHRGAMPNGVRQPISPALSTTVVIQKADGTIYTAPVDLGPCSFNGHDNLYMTTQQRQHPPAGVSGLLPFPVLAATDHVVGYQYPGRLVSVSAGALLPPGATAGGVDLTLTPFDIAGNEIALGAPETPLTLMIDTTGIYGHIDSLTAYSAPGHEVFLSTGGTENCPSYHIGPTGFLVLHVTVTDPNGHLSGYQVTSEFGHGPSPTPPATVPARRDYHDPAAPPPFAGVDAGYGQPSVVGPMPPATNVSFFGGGDTITISPRVSCCYDFRLNAGKRVTNGTDNAAGFSNQDFWTVSIDCSPIV